MPRKNSSTGPGRTDFLEQIQLPLSGLTSEGAEETVRRALRDLPGIATMTVRIVEQTVLLTYDPGVTSADAIRERMHEAGLAHPERQAEVHGTEGER